MTVSDALGVARVSIVDRPVPVASRRWVAEAVPPEVPRLRAAIVEFTTRLGAPEALIRDVRLAVSEALSNAVVHAYPGGAPGRLEVRASADPAAASMTINIRDYGTGCRPRFDSPGMGVGFPIMAALTATMEVASPADGGTEILLAFSTRPELELNPLPDAPDSRA